MVKSTNQIINKSDRIWSNYMSIWVIFLSIYLVSSILIFFLINSNIIPSRRSGEYTLDLPVNKQEIVIEGKKIVFWKYIQNVTSPTVLLLHGFTRNSKRMESRAKIYLEKGYNIYLVDNLGHGKSDFILFPSGIQFSWLITTLIIKENIKKPILHGVSMGAIASSYIAQKHPDIPMAIICEALPNNFDTLYRDMMRFMKFPYILFFWVAYLSRIVVWRQFKGKDIAYNVVNISCPIFLVHGKRDYMFLPDKHYSRNIELLSGNSKMKHWLVADSLHTRMNDHIDYKSKLLDFLSTF